ncbi:MAG: lactate racemase domain-containing protein [Verrucomicrobiota bacterium JB023]|nr:lactate racemase domain-containing protein [Verrucomicrobiota bacterium JB023]
MLLFSQGSPTTDLSAEDLRDGLRSALAQLGERKKVLAIPPDFTRFNSRAGLLTVEAYNYYGDQLVDVLPALGTHVPMPAHQLDEMFPGLPHDLVRPHRWRDDVVTIGEVPSEFVTETTEGIWTKAWPAQLNKLVWEGGHDLILSVGQVVPHEVIGMANGNKNLFVGTGGQDGINESHFIGAAYGMERMMGRADTPLRRILNEAEKLYCSHLPIIYIQTVVGPRADGSLATRGLYIGSGQEPFEAAAALAVQVNFTQLDEEPERILCYLDPTEFHSTWLGNKSIYRTRMAIATGGELTVLAPGVKEFGEDPEIDRLIRKYGYRTSPEVMDFVANNEDLANNLSAAAHLIHGSSEERFKVTYCPGHLTREEVEGVGYQYRDLEEALSYYNPSDLKEGWNEDADGRRFYYIPNPALGLWAAKSRLS